jgi:hypothetical protein
MQELHKDDSLLVVSICAKILALDVANPVSHAVYCRVKAWCRREKDVGNYCRRKTELMAA